MASINWSTWMLTPSLSLVPITAILRKVKYYKPIGGLSTNFYTLRLLILGVFPSKVDPLYEAFQIIHTRSIEDHTVTKTYGAPRRLNYLMNPNRVQLNCEHYPFPSTILKLNHWSHYFVQLIRIWMKVFDLIISADAANLFFTLNSVFELINR